MPPNVTKLSTDNHSIPDVESLQRELDYFYQELLQGHKLGNLGSRGGRGSELESPRPSEPLNEKADAIGGRLFDVREKVGRLEKVVTALVSMQKGMAILLDRLQGKKPSMSTAKDQPSLMNGLNQNQQYSQLILRIREEVRNNVPPASIVLVVNKGDDKLLQLEDREGWHFPQDEQGNYAGYYPADSAAAIAHLEKLRLKGAGFLLIPRTAFWWLDHYQELKTHLDNRYARIPAQDGTCVIFVLQSKPAEPRTNSVPSKDICRQQYIRQIREVVSHVVPPGATVIIVSKGDTDLLKLGGRKGWHFPQDAQGQYEDKYPAGSRAAIDHLETLRDKGAEFFLLPSTAFWWLDLYPDFKSHLENRYPIVARQSNLCFIFAISNKTDPRGTPL
jgi:hypothetical protein